MTPLMCVVTFQFVAGMIGTCVVTPNPTLSPASRNIDHPSKAWRIFFRIMAVCMCYMWSSLVTIIVLANTMENYDPHSLSEMTRAVLIATQPLPLLIVFYWLLAKGVRKVERDRG
ncbi:hypothetical protein [Pseudomonas syringae]|nr:hypothetical protein [Pseudomonas syringae]